MTAKKNVPEGSSRTFGTSSKHPIPRHPCPQTVLSDFFMGMHGFLLMQVLGVGYIISTARALVECEDF
jgi:hypothetical protein